MAGSLYVLICFLVFLFDQTVGSILSLIYDIDFVCLSIAEYVEVMSEKFHLNAGILREHWFDAETFGTDDLNLV